MPGTYTVLGYWPDNLQRYGLTTEAASAAHAESIMQIEAERQNALFRVAATLRGAHRPVDAAYTRYTDPQDPRNETDESLPGPQEFSVMTEFTVYGLLLSTRHLDQGWNERTGGQRFMSHELGLSALAAEAVACDRVATDENHARLIVCAVLPGHTEKAESLPFSNPRESAAHGHRLWPLAR